MVPSAFVVLHALPVTPNGKLDWKAFPAREHRLQEIALIVPRDAIETRVVRICEEVLDVRPLGVKDNFYARGVHCILATWLFVRVGNEFGRPLPIDRVLGAPVVSRPY